MKKFIRPILDLIQNAVIEFLKFWRDSPWGTKLILSPVVLVALCYYGAYVLFYGCRS